MATEITVWEIKNGRLIPLESTMTDSGRREREDLEKWIRSDSTVLGRDIVLIGEQIRTKSGKQLDFLGMDRLGNTVIVELKRDRMPRDVLAQAIDYASDVASWDIDMLNEECEKFSASSLDARLNEAFGAIDFEELSINQAQRILLVGTSVEEPLQRMIEWLADGYGVTINAIVFKYVKTSHGDELLARTMIISEEVERERTERKRRTIPMSNEPGDYEKDELEDRLRRYLNEDRATPRHIKTVLLPLCLTNDVVTREEIKREFLSKGLAADETTAGIYVAHISRELGIKSRDYLRQVILYQTPRFDWERDNYGVNPEYRELVKKLLS